MLKGGVGKRSRDEIGNCIAQVMRRRPIEIHSEDIAPLKALANSGFTPLDPLFTPEQIQSIHDYFKDKSRLYYNDNPNEPGASPTYSGQRFCEWKQEVISACPEFAMAAHDQRLLRIAEAYLGAPPTITILTSWWSFPSLNPLGGMQRFHHDRDDFRCLKLFVYLTDVDSESGPHQFVDGTHRADLIEAHCQWFDQSHRKLASEVGSRFTIRTITGPAGSTFLEDTRGLHRGVPPFSSPRLAFEICYTMLPKYNGDYKPIPWKESCEATRLFYARAE